MQVQRTGYEEMSDREIESAIKLVEELLAFRPARARTNVLNARMRLLLTERANRAAQAGKIGRWLMSFALLRHHQLKAGAC